MKDENKGRHLCESDAAKCEVCDENKCNSQKESEMNASQCLNSSCIIIITLAVWNYLI